MRTISQEQAATRPICLNGLWKTKSSLDRSIIPDVRRLRDDSALTVIAKELHSCSLLMWKEEKPHGVRVRRTRKRNGKGVAIDIETYRRNDPVVFFQLSKLLRNYELISDLTACEKTVPWENRSNDVKNRTINVDRTRLIRLRFPLLPYLSLKLQFRSAMLCQTGCHIWDILLSLLSLHFYNTTLLYSSRILWISIKRTVKTATR